jgi:hypothetical protein
MHIVDHVSALCREEFLLNMEFTARASLNTPKHLPEKIGLDSETLSTSHLPESKMVVYTLAKQGSIGMRISLVIQKSYLSICSRCRGE